MTVNHKLKERTFMGEKIGGGFIIMRRHRSTGRVSICPIGIPFEHPNSEAAVAEANRLAIQNPGKKFCVFQEISSFVIPEDSK